LLNQQASKLGDLLSVIRGGDHGVRGKLSGGPLERLGGA
jgi:hypothetical protein